VGVSSGTSVGISDGATVGEAEGLVAVGVGVAAALVGVAVLSTDNSARGSLVWPRPGGGGTVGGFGGTTVAAGVAVGVSSGGLTVGVSGGSAVGVSAGSAVGVSGSASGDASAAVPVGVAFSRSSPEVVPAPGSEGPGVALGWGPVPGSAAAGFPDARAGVAAAVFSCDVNVAAGVDVAVSCTVSMGVGRPAVMVGGCARGAGTVVGAGGAATTIAGPVAKDGFPRLGVAVGDTARPVALSSQLTTVGEPGGETSPCGTLLGPTNRAPVVAWRTAEGGGGVGVTCATVGCTTSARCA
jgi:hypothetical protein